MFKLDLTPQASIILVKFNLVKSKSVLEINKSLKIYSTYGPLLLNTNGTEPNQESFDKLTARLRQENIQDRVRSAVTEARSNPIGGDIKLRYVLKRSINDWLSKPERPSF